MYILKDVCFICVKYLITAVFLFLILNCKNYYLSESACPFGTFGTMCQFRCHCKEPLDCDKNTGNCESGCTGQWSGRNCQQGEHTK